MATQNLYQKLLAITEEIGKIDKTGNNTAQSYKFIEQSVVVAEVRVQLAKHGVMIIPETVSRTMDRYTTMKPGYNGQPAKEQASFHANVVSRYTLVNADDPTDRQVCEWDAGEALDTSDKATNKATTASHKYFLMKLFNISDKDDPDADSHEAPAQKPASAPYKPQSVPTPEPVNNQPFGQAEGLTEPQVRELLDLAKKKGMKTKEDAIGFLNTQAMGDFTKLPADQFESFRALVIKAGWGKANGPA